jgi:E3 ubiquitin-protein ligase HECTD1
MSLTSTSSDSDNDFLEMCRASTLLAELEDDEDLPEPDEEMDDNEDDLKDDEEYDDVMVYLMFFCGLLRNEVKSR